MEFDLQIALSRLTKAGIDEKQLEELQVIILPENFDGDQRNMRDGQDAITLSKLLKTQNVKCANSFDLQMDVPTIERRSNDIWIGEIFILKDIVLPAVIAVVTSYLSNAIAEWKNRKDVRSPAANVHADITLVKSEGITAIKYSGDPEGFVKILESLEKKTNEQ